MKKARLYKVMKSISGSPGYEPGDLVAETAFEELGRLVAKGAIQRTELFEETETPIMDDMPSPDDVARFEREFTSEDGLRMVKEINRLREQLDRVNGELGAKDRRIAELENRPKEGEQTPNPAVVPDRPKELGPNVKVMGEGSKRPTTEPVHEDANVLNDPDLGKFETDPAKSVTLDVKPPTPSTPEAVEPPKPVEQLRPEAPKPAEPKKPARR